MGGQGGGRHAGRWQNLRSPEGGSPKRGSPEGGREKRGSPEGGREKRVMRKNTAEPWWLALGATCRSVVSVSRPGSPAATAGSSECLHRSLVGGSHSHAAKAASYRRPQSRPREGFELSEWIL